jgi:hypothetical protein
MTHIQLEQLRRDQLVAVDIFRLKNKRRPIILWSLSALVPPA